MRPSERQTVRDSEAFCQKSIHCLKLSQPCFFCRSLFGVSICRFLMFQNLHTLLQTTYIFDQHKKQPKTPALLPILFFGCSVSTAVSVSEIQTQHILGHKMWEKFKIRIRKLQQNPWTFSPPVKKKPLRYVSLGPRYVSLWAGKNQDTNGSSMHPRTTLPRKWGLSQGVE